MRREPEAPLMMLAVGLAGLRRWPRGASVGTQTQIRPVDISAVLATVSLVDIGFEVQNIRPEQYQRTVVRQVRAVASA